MIERLRQTRASADPVLNRAAQLLQSLEPTEDSAGARRRVWTALSEQPRHVSRRFWLARPVLAAALTVCLTAAVAGASVGRGFFAQVKSVFLTSSEPTTMPSLSSAKPRARAPQRLAPRSASAETPATSAAPPTAAANLPEPATAPANRPPHRAAASRPPAAKRTNVGAEAFAAAPREEASLVLGAMAALRRDHDPARSASLLSIYLYKYPKGVLREEALALQMEAASSLRDPDLGARYARGYLQSHPNGRFSDLAKNALERSATSESKP